MEKKNEYEGFRFSDLCVVIKVSANSMDDIKEIVKQTSEIQKITAATALLNVNLPNKVSGIKLTHASKG
ncbi:MAG: hypothetical protein ACLU45_02045 [Dialister invisus]|uniref:hypothetical protein n=1 Tax=Dialister invisus TaxID=218538 RepID=UPI00399B1F0C